ncbi:MAG TPA: RNA polymerase sigma factor RpoD/SigA [Solirubrobacteraceae bacterium]|nr:RNA polymerase sigma factor RpoD/SigA [Solirubrobacteraceae bacterium]
MTDDAEHGEPGARRRMIEGNLGLVHAVARMYRGRGVPHADLVQEGTVGLVRAVERFDHSRGVKFSTYAMWWIRRSMLDAIASSNVIRMPPRATRQRTAVRRAEAELERIARGSASDEAIAERTDLSLSTVRSLRRAATVTASLDQPIGDDTTVLGELVADDRAPDPSEIAIARENRNEVSAMVRLLPERHREVVSRRYGLDGRPVQTHEEIGAWLGVGEERSRQLEHDALRRLRSVADPLARAA